MDVISEDLWFYPLSNYPLVILVGQFYKSQYLSTRQPAKTKQSLLENLTLSGENLCFRVAHIRWIFIGNNLRVASFRPLMCFVAG
jgi:hypothetical protein